MAKKRDTERHGLKRIIGLTVLALTAAAVVKELRQPTEQRTWQGTVAGFVPYDLRFPPTLARVKASLWAPEDPRLLLPRSFGVGWAPNIGRLVAQARSHGAADHPVGS